MRVLLIDDDPELPAQLTACSAQVHSTTPWDCVAARDDDEALSLLNSPQHFDLAFVNIDGGEISGLNVFRQLVARSRRIPRIALTRGADFTRVKAALAQGAADLVQKPVNPDDLIATVERVMRQVERRRRNWHDRGAYMALRREVDLAADMQRRILPQRFPDDTSLDFAAIMQPARGVGGDFYDVFRIDDRHIGLLIADVSGKGVPAAFYMAVASTTLRAVGLRGVAPGAALGEVNNNLVGRDIPGVFVSVFYAVINTATWQVRCSNAGHGAPLLLGATDAAAALASAGGPILGILESGDYEESTFELAPGSGLLLHTDGVTEALNLAREQFGETRLAALVSANRDADCTTAIAALREALNDYSSGMEQHDDITALAVRRRRVS